MFLPPWLLEEEGGWRPLRPLGALARLTVLYMDACRLHYLPQELGQLRSLKVGAGLSRVAAMGKPVLTFGVAVGAGLDGGVLKGGQCESGCWVAFVAGGGRRCMRWVSSFPVLQLCPQLSMQHAPRAPWAMASSNSTPLVWYGGRC